MLTERLRSLCFWALVASLTAASFSNSLFEIFTGIFLCAGLCLLACERKFESFEGPFAAAATLYLLVALVSCTQSQYLDNSLRGVFRVLRCVLMVFFARRIVDTRERFGIVFFFMTTAAVLIALDACFQGVFGHDLIRHQNLTPYLSGWGRVTGPFHHANDFAAYLSLMIFFFIGMIPYAFRRGSVRERGFFLGGAMLLIACLLWTCARGAWLAVAATLILMMILKRSRLFAALLVPALLLIFLFSPPAVKGRISSLVDMKDSTMVERVVLWRESLDMWKQRPLLGFGINTYSKVEPAFKSKTVYSDNQYAHNGYLQMAAETGSLGLGAFLLVLGVFFTQTVRTLRKCKDPFVYAAGFGMALGLVGLLLQSATDTTLQSLRLLGLIWLCMGVVLSIKNMEKWPAR